VADHAFGLMLAVAHRVVELDKRARAGHGARPGRPDGWPKTLGIIGLGRIGKGVAQRASGFEMRVLAYEPFPDHDFCARWKVELVELDDLFRRSDYVTVHAPGEGVNEHLVNRERLALMRPTGIVINTARGVLVDEAALYEALETRRIAGAGLDVRVHEPPREDPFARFDNVVLTPHVAGSTVEAQAVSSAMVVESVLQAARGESPHGLLNPEAWDRRRR
jgi:D-3-phosphoglycerate dehydrogenase